MTYHRPAERRAHIIPYMSKLGAYMYALTSAMPPLIVSVTPAPIRKAPKNSQKAACNLGVIAPYVVLH